VNDFVPVAFLAQFDMLLATKADSPHDSVAELNFLGQINCHLRRC
jgi:tripartite-type tricarboxylate transporter receptor subunit TctC